MARGRYARKKQKSRIWILLPVIGLLVALALVLTMCAPGAGEPEPTEFQENPGQTTEPETQPTTEPPTDPATEPPTDPATEPATEPTEEPTTEPTEEPTTEPTTEPTEEPTTEPTEEPTTEPEETEPQVSPAGEAVAELAVELVGTAYEFGASGPDTFDTTGFVYYCFRQNGVMAPREMSGQAAYGQEIPADGELQPGDVVFFWTSTPGQVEYVGIYIGDGQFVAARNPEKPTSIMSLESGYFAERFLFARRYYE